MNFDQSILPTRGLVKTRKKNDKGKRKHDESSSSSSLKVVYISSPMKVKTSASRFRSLVQELTGKHSDISQYMDDSNWAGGDFHHEIDCGEEEADQGGSLGKDTTSDDRQKLLFSSSISPDDTPTSSEYAHMDDSMFVSQIDDQFEGIFSSDSFYEPSRMDVLGSFDELLYD